VRALGRIQLAKAAAGVALTGVFAFAWWMQANGLASMADLASELSHPPEKRFDWSSVDKKHWQVVTQTPPESTAVTDAREATSAGCGAGMVRVKGGFHVGGVESLQDDACTDWISKDFPARCRTFDADRIRASIADVPVHAMDYCIDRFEYPNQLGANPIIVVTFHEAEAMCKKAQKRLCSETEWTFACEGEEARPYPYGYTRDATACVVDRNWRPFAEGALQPRDGQQAREELDRLWQGEPSGSRGGCKSAFGVYDMTGNVDEWTRSVRTTGYSSVLKGGYWGPVRARCRPATRAHNEDFVAYQQGFRCCADADATVAAPPRPTATAIANALASPPPLAPAAAAVDLPALEHPSPFEGRDELEGIRRARVGLSCTTSRAPTPNGIPALVLVATAAAALFRRRKLTAGR
jgi:hypothetical protein